MTYLSAPFLFMPTGQREAAAVIASAVAGPGALATLVGVEGAGKTTVLRRAAAELANQSIRVVQVSAAPPSGLSLAGLVAQIGGQTDPAASQDEKRERAFEALTELDDDVERIALLVDDAHRLEPSALRYIQLACRSSPMLRVVLARSPDVLGPLDEEGFASVRERIAHRVELAPLSSDEAAAFVAHLLHAGGMPARRALLPAASDALVRHGLGNPGRIDVLLRRALVLAVVRNEAPLRPETVEQAVAALDGIVPIPPPASVQQVKEPPRPPSRRPELIWALAGLGIGASLALAVLTISGAQSVSKAVSAAPPGLVAPVAPVTASAPVAVPIPAVVPPPAAAPVLSPMPPRAEIEASAGPQAFVTPDAPPPEATPPVAAIPLPSGSPAATVRAKPSLPPPQVEASRPPSEPARAARSVRTPSEPAPELRSGGQRCRDIVLKAQLGDEISNEDRQFLRAGCPTDR